MSKSGINSTAKLERLDTEEKEVVTAKPSIKDRIGKWLVPGLILLLVITGTFNTIAGKIRSEPLGEYSGFVTSIIGQFVYFTVYWSILGGKALLGYVTKEEFLWVWTPRKDSEIDPSKRGIRRWWARLPGIKYTFFSSISDVMGDNLMFMTQPYLSIIVFNLLQQGMVPFTLVWSCLILAARYTLQELFGVALVVAMTIASAITSSTSEGSSSIGMSILCLMSTMFQALGFVIKEYMFRDYTDFAEKHGYKQKNLDVFAVSSSNHTFGILWVFPVSILVEMVRTDENVFDVMAAGFETLLTAHGAMSSFAVYMVINVCFNITIYLLVSYGSSLLTFVSLKITVPLSAFMSLISWPLVGADTVTWFEWVSLVVIMSGVVIFRHGNGKREKLEAENERIEGSGDTSVAKSIICFWPLFRKRRSPSSAGAAEVAVKSSDADLIEDGGLNGSGAAKN
ncbi:hypothetical protein FOL47_003984 [Perkinsus chesapeaki]|uniref:Sugar phosphate transporter domain-containing protein n=1 Tax=Perkinsus chesapeaki TaxID=330153 RepID=A0A7J6N051_PERCH|nr:hypothetical protein FOL47_003984 [Perkinsus chesapeaki]